MDDDILSDDLMPTDGSLIFPERDEERVKAENVEKAMIRGAGPLLEKIVGILDQEIARAGTIDGLDLSTGPDLTAQILAKQQLVELLTGVKSTLIALDNRYNS